MNQGTVASSHDIVISQPFDQFASNLSQGISGDFALKLGSTTTQSYIGKSQMASYTFKVTNQNKYFKFQYAVVLVDDPTHTEQNTSFFQYYVTKKGRKIPNPWSFKQMRMYNRTEHKKFADVNDPYFQNTGQITDSNEPIIYRDWTCKILDLTKYVGEELTIHFISSDCQPGPDWGYAYIDALCENSTATVNFTLPDEACKGENITLNATTLANEDSWMISIQESNIGRERFGKEYIHWYTAQKGGQINLTDLAKQLDLDFKCDTYYRVKVVAVNECSGWNEYTRLLKINCPNVSLPEDFTICCPTDPSATISFPIQGDLNLYTISGSSSNGESVDLNSNTATFTSKAPLENTKYTFTITKNGNTGCTLVEEVNVSVKKPIKVDILEIGSDQCSSGSCYGKLKLDIKTKGCDQLEWVSNPNINDLEIEWNTGQTTSEIELSGNNSNETYFTANVSNSCYSESAAIRGLVSTPAITGDFPTLHPGPNSMNLNSTIAINRRITVYDYSLDKDAPNAYNATAYKMYIYNRLGEMIRIVEGCNENGFTNGDIYWDGKITNGNYAPMATYVYVVYLKNCSSPYFERMTKYAYSEKVGSVCNDWVTLWGKKLWCSKRADKYEIQVSDKRNGLNKMNVLRL